MKIIIDIENCSACPNFLQGPMMTTDGWDTGYDWICIKKNKKIAGFVEWHEGPQIPEWCPCKFIEEDEKLG